MKEAPRPKRPKIERGDKVMFNQTSKHMCSGIVSRVNGAYVYVVRRIGRHTFTQEFYDIEIRRVVSKGNSVPETDHERELADKRRQTHRQLAMRLAEVYHGRPVSEDYVFGEATGGAMFGALATAAQELLDPS